MRNGTYHAGGGTRRVGSHGTARYNMYRGMIQQPEGIRHDVRCGAPVTRGGSTGRCEVGVEIPTQWLGEQIHALTRTKHGDIRDRVEGVRCGDSERGDGSIGCGVDSGVGYRFGIANKSH